MSSKTQCNSGVDDLPMLSFCLGLAAKHNGIMALTAFRVGGLRQKVDTNMKVDTNGLQEAKRTDDQKKLNKCTSRIGLPWHLRIHRPHSQQRQIHGLHCHQKYCRVGIRDPPSPRAPRETSRPRRHRRDPPYQARHRHSQQNHTGPSFPRPPHQTTYPTTPNSLSGTSGGHRFTRPQEHHRRAGPSTSEAPRLG